ncbi:hypothetical protein [Pseudomonas sp.]|uniref:hypothetical protein n=1 Tax=Pseudomonas sp. TaxID=306 RepID=UPI0028ADE1AD|nr:hypothetical protein [Pseudomonas sp.]
MKAAEVEGEIRKLEPEAQQAYLDQIEADVRSLSISQIEQAVADGDDSRVEELMALGLMALLLERLRGAFVSGATQEIKVIRIPGVRREFDVNDPDVNPFLSGQARALREQALRDQAEAIRVTIAAGRARGDSPRTTALNLAGRVSPQTGRRTGGVSGLTGPAAEAIERARDQLGSGLPGPMRDYLNRNLRDPAFDGAVRKAIEEERPVPAKIRRRAAARYSERLLQALAQALAETNVAEAYNRGRQEGWRQLTQRSNGLYSYRKTWRTKRDGKERPNHGAMNGQQVDAGQPFTSPSGAQLMYPCDPSLGAPMSERARCRCTSEYTLVRIMRAE